MSYRFKKKRATASKRADYVPVFTAISDMAAGSNNLYSIAWSDKLELFVAVGESGAGTYSADGVTWTAVSDMKFALSTIYGIVWSADLELFVAVGASGKGSYSADGINWTAIADTKVADTLYSVTWSSSLGLFIALVDASATGCYSTDGITWTAIADTNTSTRIVAASKTGSTVVALKASLTSSFSSNATLWESTNDVGFGANIILGATHSSYNGIFLAVGSGQKISYSSNGEDWTAVVDTQFPAGATVIIGVESAETSRVILAVGGVAGSGAASYSYDGITWIAVSDTKVNNILWGVSFSPKHKRFVTVGLGGKGSYTN